MTTSGRDIAHSAPRARRHVWEYTTAGARAIACPRAASASPSRLRPTTRTTKRSKRTSERSRRGPHVGTGSSRHAEAGRRRLERTRAVDAYGFEPQLTPEGARARARCAASAERRAPRWRVYRDDETDAMRDARGRRLAKKSSVDANLTRLIPRACPATSRRAWMSISGAASRRAAARKDTTRVSCATPRTRCSRRMTRSAARGGARRTDGRSSVRRVLAAAFRGADRPGHPARSPRTRGTTAEPLAAAVAPPCVTCFWRTPPSTPKRATARA